ncbi:hypothetical protein QQ054_10695 [Oscillatoria amoena NRMC-F 0135]|nr:hypothetical protein [Oscillatoria amoena NRMC-F 0135]
MLFKTTYQNELKQLAIMEKVTFSDWWDSLPRNKVAKTREEIFAVILWEQNDNNYQRFMARKRGQTEFSELEKKAIREYTGIADLVFEPAKELV